MHNDVVLKVHVSVETAAGERIAEVRTSQVFSEMFSETMLRSAEAAMVKMLETQVISPCRGLIRAHVGKLQDPTFTRRDTCVPLEWPDGVAEDLNQRLEAVMAR